MRYENSETAGWFTIRARSTDMGEMTSYVSGGLKPMTVSGVKVTAAHYPAGSSGGTFTDGYLATYKKKRCDRECAVGRTEPGRVLRTCGESAGGVTA